MQLGDMVSRGVPRNFPEFFRQFSDAAPRTPYLTVIGNHDRRRPRGVSDYVTCVLTGGGWSWRPAPTA